MNRLIYRGIILQLAIPILALGLSCCIASDPEVQPIFVSGEGYGRFRIPALVAMPCGTLLAFAEGRADGGGLTGNIDIVLRRSLDGGATWQPLQVVVDLGKDTAGNPCAVVDKSNGSVWLAFTRAPGKLIEKEIIEGADTVGVWLTHSLDAGLTWSEPVDLSAACRDPSWRWYGTGPGVGIQLQSGRLLIPCYHSGPDRIYRSHVIFSDDHGVSWKVGGTVGENTSASQAIEKSNGTVVLNMRGVVGQGLRTVAESADGGLSWKAPTLEPLLPEAGCHASLLLVPGNAVEKGYWIFCNPPGPTRHKLTARLSFDEGSAWPVSQILDGENNTEYSSLACLPNGEIAILYEMSPAKKSYRPQLLFSKFPAGWPARLAVGSE